MIKIKGIPLDLNKIKDLHPIEIAKILKKARKNSKEDFLQILNSLCEDTLGLVILELPENLKHEIFEEFSSLKLKEAIVELETDDAKDLLSEIEEFNEEKAEEIFEKLDKFEQESISILSRYEDNQAGAFMQKELFDVNINEKLEDAITRLKELKKSGELENIHQAFVVNEFQKLIGSIPLEDLIIHDFNVTFREVLYSIEKDVEQIEVRDSDDIKDVVKIFENYDLTVIPVVDNEGKLIGRITSDDIYDIIEESKTEEIYKLAGVKEADDYEGGIFAISKRRGYWLFLNLFTAILGSVVIGIFEDTIQTFVALAILMPIVASLGGNAGIQSLTVVIRKLALEEIEYENGMEVVKKEVLITLLNGLFFGTILGIIAWLWFDKAILGLILMLAIAINLINAGLFGAFVPLMLKRFNIDPAVASGILVTTATDIVGFFCFLGLAKLILVG